MRLERIVLNLYTRVKVCYPKIDMSKPGAIEKRMSSQLDGKNAFVDLQQKMVRIANRSLDVLEEALNGERVSRTQLEAAKKGSDFCPSLGVGSTGQPINVHIQVPRPELQQRGEVEGEVGGLITAPSSESSETSSASGEKESSPSSAESRKRTGQPSSP